MTDTIKRAVRSAFQGFLGVLVLIAVPWLNGLIQTVAGGGDVQIDTNFVQAIGIAGVAGALVGLISWAQNAFEDKSGTNVLPK